jgi:3-hydroxyacyl-[acyl-carrier-protein] dehydratase
MMMTMRLLNEMYSIVGGDDDNIQIRLQPQHFIYQAHFPGMPITPGVCLVQIVGELLERRLAMRLKLSEVVNLKFIALISPIDNPLMTVCLQSVDVSADGCHARGVFKDGDEIKTKFSIKYISAE